MPGEKQILHPQYQLLFNMANSSTPVSTSGSGLSRSSGSQTSSSSGLDNTSSSDGLKKNMSVHATDELLKKLNQKFDKKTWEKTEQHVPPDTQNVLKCLKKNLNGAHTPHVLTTVAESLYLEIRDEFLVLPDKKAKSKKETEKKETEKKETEKKGAPKKGHHGKQEWKPREKKEDKLPRESEAAAKIRAEATSARLYALTQALKSTFSKERLNFEFGLFTNDILELRIITFMHCAEQILKGKNAKAYREKPAEVLEIQIAIALFIAKCKEYKGQSFANSSETMLVSSTAIADLQYCLDELKKAYPYDGLTVYKTAPQLIMNNAYKKAIPGQGISMRLSQRRVLETFQSHLGPNGMLLFVDTPIGSGKTSTTIGLAGHIDDCIKADLLPADTQLLFVCNGEHVRIEVGRYCVATQTQFGMGSLDKNGHPKIHYHKKTNPAECRVVIASPEVAVKLLKCESQFKMDPLKVLTVYDEITTGADKAKSESVMANADMARHLSLNNILFSATMPKPNDLPAVMASYLNKYPNAFVDVLSANDELPIAATIRTLEDGKLVKLHSICENKDDLDNYLKIVKYTPNLAKLLSFPIAESLWKSMVANKVEGVTDLRQYFADANNLTSEKVRAYCVTLFELLAQQPEALIRQVCSHTEQNESTSGGIDFSRLNLDAWKYPNMTLIATNDPVKLTQEAFVGLLEDIRKSDVDPSDFKGYVSDYLKKLDAYEARKEAAKEKFFKKGVAQVSSNNAATQEASKFKLSVTKGDTSNKLQRFEGKEADERNCSEEDKPTLKWPLKFQINTSVHLAKNGSQHRFDLGNVRSEIDITSLPLKEEFSVPSFLLFLLCCGVGVYAPGKITDEAYTREVLRLATAGKLAFLIVDDSVAYGANFANLCRVIVTKDFAETHSLNTLFQVTGRAGRAGLAWLAEWFVPASVVPRLQDFARNPDNEESRLEARNINQAIIWLDEMDRQKNEEESKKREYETELNRVREARLNEEAKIVSQNIEKTLRKIKEQTTKQHEEGINWRARGLSQSSEAKPEAKKESSWRRQSETPSSFLIPSRNPESKPEAKKESSWRKQSDETPSTVLIPSRNPESKPQIGKYIPPSMRK